MCGGVKWRFCYHTSQKGQADEPKKGETRLDSTRLTAGFFVGAGLVFLRPNAKAPFFLPTPMPKPLPPKGLPPKGLPPRLVFPSASLTPGAVPSGGGGGGS